MLYDLANDMRLAQRVPETPIVPSFNISAPRTENLHLEFSCKPHPCFYITYAKAFLIVDNPELPGGRGHVQLRSVAEIRILFQSLAKTKYIHVAILLQPLLE